MTLIHIHKAQPVGDNQVIENLLINIEVSVPDSETIEEGDELMENDATELVEALYNVLPGGTFDRVLIKMLQHRTTHLHVPFGGLL